MNKKVPSLDSFYQLLKGKVFYNTDYQSWLIECMRQATLPIHPKFSLIINEFAISTFTVDKIQKIPEEIILDEFRDYKYSTQLLDQIPIKYILNHVETFQKGEAYKAIYSDMLAVSANLFPELFEVSSFLIQEGKDMDMLWDMETKKRKKNTKKIDLGQLRSVFSQHDTNHTLVIEVLSQLEYSHINDIEGYAKCMISVLLPLCLEGKLDFRVADSFISAWESLNNIIPHSLWVMTINTLTE
ncbi:Integrator complex subunit 2, partial [Rhizopus stolonifer]